MRFFPGWYSLVEQWCHLKVLNPNCPWLVCECVCVCKCCVYVRVVDSTRKAVYKCSPLTIYWNISFQCMCTGGFTLDVHTCTTTLNVSSHYQSKRKCPSHLNQVKQTLPCQIPSIKSVYVTHWTMTGNMLMVPPDVTDLRWAQRNFPSEDERQRAHTSFCTVRLKHHRDILNGSTGSVPQTFHLIHSSLCRGLCFFAYMNELQSPLPYT